MDRKMILVNLDNSDWICWFDRYENIC